MKASQARADLDVLVERGRRIRPKDVDAGLVELQRALDVAFG
jgi:hypothetical protein